MKKIFLIIILFCSNLLFSQNIEQIQVPSNGSVISSKVTESDIKYIITVEGTYSMWPQFTDCHGVDAAYVWDVPQDEIDSFRWPPKEIDLGGGIKIPFVEIPHWVGDDKLWAFPPKEIGTPLFEISFRKYKGFRIDGEPLPNTGIQMVTHRYQIEKMGTGKPFEFQIIDSNYSILQEGVIPRYEDNCGNLKVTIEKVENEGINICDVEPICKDGKYIGLKLWASIFVKDTSNISGKDNLLNYIDIKQLGIVENGKFRCDIDSIVCKDESGTISLGLLVDRSGSMAMSVSETENTIRMDASKNAINGFIDKLKDKDSTFVMSFSSTIILEQDWTADKQKMKAAINQLQPESKTAVYGAILQALSKLSTATNPNKYLIVLSDGANTFPPDWSETILKSIQNYNIPIFIVALGLSKESEDIEGRQKFGIIAQASRGKVFDVNNTKELDSTYSKLSREIYNSDCCAIYFKIDPCKAGEERYIRIIYAPQDTVILTKVIKFICDTCDKINSIKQFEDYGKEIEGLKIAPNPSNNIFRLTFELETQSNVIIQISDLIGNIISQTNIGLLDKGKKIYDYSGSSLKQGAYIISVVTKENIISRKLIFVK